MSNPTTIRDGDRARALADRRPRVTIVCAVCGQPRLVVQMAGRRQARTCGDRCRRALQRRERRAELAAE